MSKSIFEKLSLFLLLIAISAVVSFSQTTFPGTGVGPIPDGPSTSCPTAGTPLNITFNVTGISGPPSNISVSMTFSPAHTWVGDIRAVLTAPNGTSFVIFGQTGLTTATGFGDSSDLAGPYNFNNAATGNWWAEAAAQGSTSALTAGAYRTSQPGGAGATGAVTDLNAAFASIPTSNGTWTLAVTDSCSGDTGTVSAASLTLTAGSTPSGKANVDFNGDGKSDFVIARATTVPFSPGTDSNNRLQFESVRERLKYDRERPVDLLSPNANVIDWWIATQTTFNVNVWRFGNADTDFLTPGDFDGDGKKDVAVWRPGAPGSAQYIVLRSSDLTVQTFNFGQTGDDPTLVGDYDGDGKADPAVFRCPSGTAGQCYFFYLDRVANPSGVVTYVPWGFGTDADFFAAPGDYDGDGKYDFCFQRTHPSFPGQGLFVLLRSSDLGAEYIPWGLNTDFIIPGDFDGDGKSDFCVRRTVSGSHRFYILTRTGGGTGASYIQFGVTGDYAVPGDYDGDGKTDIAEYRPGTGGGNGVFWVAPSGGGSVQLFPWGIAGDYPVANWQVH